MAKGAPLQTTNQLCLSGYYLCDFYSSSFSSSASSSDVENIKIEANKATKFGHKAMNILLKTTNFLNSQF